MGPTGDQQRAHHVKFKVVSTVHKCHLDSPMMAVELAHVSSTGETMASYDHSVVTPDSFDDFAELYTGGTETGNVALAVPPDDDGTLRVRLGFLDTQDFFFEASE